MLSPYVSSYDISISPFLFSTSGEHWVFSPFRSYLEEAWYAYYISYAWVSNKPNLSDVLSAFFDDEEETECKRQSFPCDVEDDDSGSDDEGRSADGRVAETNTFWEKQNQLLQEALDCSSSIEKRIRTDTENVLRRIQSLAAVCSCSGKPMLLCRNCMLGDISDRLRDVGYNSALCTSKWRRSLDILSGEYSFVDVVVDTKKDHARVVIDLSFRAEFEMARASPGYNSLVARLPGMFVDKSEKLCSVIKIMCAATKKCMKENKMHLAPWRKHRYMQSKWLGTSQRTTSAAPLLHAAKKVSDRQPKQRTSMLTLDLHQTAGEAI